MPFRQLASGLLATAVVLGLSAAPVAADPQTGLVVENVCNDGNVYTTIAATGADWNAQLDTDSTSVFHLTWYEITYEVTAPDGTVTVFGPDTVKKGGNDREHKKLLGCTFAFDADLGGGFTSHVSGPSRGWLTPAVK
jgi:hypothetical protein